MVIEKTGCKANAKICSAAGEPPPIIRVRPARSQTVNRKLLSADVSWYGWKNRSILSEVLDDSFVLVHMTGMRQSKAAFIQTVEDGILNYYYANHQRMETNVSGGQAELIGQSEVNAAVFGSGPHTWRLQLKTKPAQRGMTGRPRQ